MQVSELLKIVMEEKPHSFSESKIISWLNEVECEVQQQLGISPFVPVEYDSDNLSAALIPIDRPIKVEVALTVFLGKKVSFEFDSKNNKIISIEYEE